MTNASLSKTVAGQGFEANVMVSIRNLGNKVEGFTLTVYVNATVIYSQYVTLNGGSSADLVFTWNTTGYAYGNRSLAAFAEALKGEVLVENNNFTDGWVFISMAGDINGDKAVNIFDAVLLASAAGSDPSKPNWNANADINNDGVVNIFDAVILAAHAGQTEA